MLKTKEIMGDVVKNSYQCEIIKDSDRDMTGIKCKYPSTVKRHDFGIHNNYEFNYYECKNM